MGGVLGFLRRLLNGLLSLVKWPMALGTLSLLPTLGDAFLEVLDRLLDDSGRAAAFVEGFLLYLVAWLLLLKGRFVGSWLSTLEHELTHPFFALPTLHRVKLIKTSH